MADLNAATAADVIAVCEAGLGEISESFSRTFDAPVEVTLGEPATLDPAALPEGFDAPGLVAVLVVGPSAALVVVPESGGLLPDWYAEPDPTGTSKLSTLAQELGVLVLPEELMPEDCQASRVAHLGEALSRGGVDSGAALVPLVLKASDDRGVTAGIIWPASTPGEIHAACEAEAAPEQPSAPLAETAAAPAVEPDPSGSPAGQTAQGVLGIDGLPSYSRSLLRIPVTVTVTLASQKQPIGRIMELGPGSLVQFDKSCEELLKLEVNGREVGRGEAVKVGDKFGIRLTSLIVPDERFKPVRPQQPTGK